MSSTMIVYPNFEAQISGIEWLTTSPKGKVISIKFLNSSELIKVSSKLLAGVDLTNCFQVEEALQKILF